VRSIMGSPSLGEEKQGDLSHVRVYKFKMNNQLSLLAYTYDITGNTLTLLSLGAHENFYRDLKKK
jgi:hypothetical protein